MVYSTSQTTKEEMMSKQQALDTYSDASHMADWEKSQLGVICYLDGAPVAWRTTLATLASGSTCESELQAAVLGAQMGVGLTVLLEDMGIRVDAWQGIDNQAALSVLQDTSSWRTRHLAIRSAVLRDLVREGILRCSHVGTTEQFADGLTKFLKPEPHQRAMVQWQLVPLELVNQATAAEIQLDEKLDSEPQPGRTQPSWSTTATQGMMATVMSCMVMISEANPLDDEGEQVQKNTIMGLVNILKWMEIVLRTVGVLLMIKGVMSFLGKQKEKRTMNMEMQETNEKIEKRTVMTQSMTTYTSLKGVTNGARFLPLGDREHGAWSEGVKLRAT